MDFETAKRMVIPFGKFKGKTIDNVASTDEGLLWLDWAVSLDTLHGTFHAALHAYMADDMISREVDEALERRGRS